MCITAACIACLLFPGLAAAQDQRAVLELIVNRVSAGESLVVLRGSDVLVSTASLQKAGLRGFAGRRDTLGGEEFVSLASLAPDVTFSVDELELRLTLTANPELLGRTVRDLSERRAGQSRLPQGTPRASSTTPRTGTATVSSTSSPSRQPACAVRHLQHGLREPPVGDARADERDVRSARAACADGRSATASATAARSAAMPGSAGISVAKEFAIDPYYVRYPTLSLSTPIAVPSVMEVYVNGQVVSQERVAPGRLDVRNLPLTMGRNDARVIVRDAFGADPRAVVHLLPDDDAHSRRACRTINTTSASGGSASAKRAGTTERRSCWPGIASGVTDSFTAGGRVEMHPGRLVQRRPVVQHPTSVRRGRSRSVYEPPRGAVGHGGARRRSPTRAARSAPAAR